MAADDTGRPGDQAAAEAARRQPAPGPFARFTRAEWIAWIRKFLNGGLCDPPVVAGAQEPFEALAGVYYELDSKNQRDLFASAVAALFDDAPIVRQNARYFRALIELLALLRPYEAKAMLRRHLYGRSFVGLEDGLTSLHTLLLVANSKYDLDEDFLDFIDRTARAADDFPYLLASLRIVSAGGGPAYLGLLETMLGRMKAEKHYGLLARELGDIFFLHGVRHFCQWYGAAARRIERGHELFDSFERFEGALKKHVFRRLDLSPGSAADPLRTLVAAQLHAYDRRFNAKEVLAIARLHHAVGKDAAVDALVNIWNRIKTVLSGGEHPWYLSYMGNPALPVCISSGPVPNTSISAKFTESEEPALVEIFLAVREADAGLNEALKKIIAFRSRR